MGPFFAILLPVFGFIGCAILIKYKSDYLDCIKENKLEGKNGLNKPYDDLILTWLRRLHTLMLAQSVSYFFFIPRYKVLQIINSVIYQFILIAMVICGYWGISDKEASVCGSTVYGRTVASLGILCILSGAILLIVHFGLFVYYLIFGMLPE